MRPGRSGVILLVLVLSSPLLAQEQRGAIEGVVRDAQGAVTPGAVVRVHSAAGLALEVVSDKSGTYRFASLPPGRYELTATLSGFVSARVVNIDLKLGVELRIDLALQTAGVAETVEVVRHPGGGSQRPAQERVRRTICTAYFRTSAGGSPRRSIDSARVRPATYSMAMKLLPLSSSMS